MKRILLLVCLMLSIWQESMAQVFAYLSPGTTAANIYPWASTTTNRRATIFYPSNFPGAPAGNIVKLYFKISASVTTTFTNFEIKMGNTALTQFTTGPWITAGMTTVFSSPSFNVSSGALSPFAGNWVPVTLTTPFYYDGVQNFIVDFSQQGYTTAMSVSQASVAGLTARTMYGSVTGTGTQQDRVTEIAIEIAPAACSGTPNVATITGPAAPVCNGTNVALGVTGQSNGSTFTYQWQSRPAGAGVFTDIPGATSATYNATPAQSTDYQFVTKCTSSGLSSVSSPFTVNVLQNPSANGINETHIGLAYDFAGVNVQNATTQQWDFGDGFTSAIGSHTYATGGNYTVTLTLTNSCGSSTVQTNISASPNTPCTTPAKPDLTTETTEVCTGKSFDIKAEGYTINMNIGFQWQRSPAGGLAFTDIPGETGTQLTTSETEGGDYRLVSTCASTGNITLSDPVSISVIPVPKIVAPENVSVFQFENAVFTANTTLPKAKVTYRWQSQAVNDTAWVYVIDNGNYRGALTPTLTVQQATIAQDGMKFRCILEEEGGCNYVPEISDAAILTVTRSTSVADKYLNNNISVYPNPVSGSELFVKADSKLPEGTRVAISDVMGRQMVNEILNIKGSVNISMLPAGNYHVRIMDADNVVISTMMFTRN